MGSIPIISTMKETSFVYLTKGVFFIIEIKIHTFRV